MTHATIRQVKPVLPEDCEPPPSTSRQQKNIDFLRELDLFKGLPEDDLERLCEMSENVVIPAGEYLMREGDPGGSLYVIRAGEFEVTQRMGGQEVVLAVRGPREVIGEISLLDQKPRSASVRALTQTDAITITHDAFYHLLTTSASAAIAIMHTMIQRVRSNEAILRQSEKMAGLGTLAAGLAHELNNPAAAARRSAEQLKDALTRWVRLANRVGTLGLSTEQLQTVNRLRDEIIERASQPTELDPLAQSDRESELQDYFESRGVDRAWDLAPTLVGVGWSLDSIQRLGQQFDDEQLGPVAEFLEAGTTVYGLLDDVSKSAERISEIVKSVKTYSYLDQAPIQNVDVHEGLENTIVILKHKLKAKVDENGVARKGVTIRKDYDPKLPRIEALGSELNQAWTNIMDNAIDAMNGEGVLTLHTHHDDEHIYVDICDTGPGIPEHIKGRIFDPFFTTKPPGVGTGMGLHITYNIIASKHHGTIAVDSRAGQTCFNVSLPVKYRK